jgi:mitogen-activated protein kinase kinase kinase
MGAKVRRHRSFAKNRDQWNFRPPAEHVYDNLEEFFPKIDLDKPVVDAVIANPHIEEPSPKAVSPDRPYEDDPSTYRVPSSARPGGFNKLESRKSIRFVAEGRKKHLSKIAPVNKAQQTSLERKRSSSMWGHRVVEVTPSKLKSGNIPATEGGNAAQSELPQPCARAPSC